MSGSAWPLVLGFLAGAGLGGLYFGGLWLTVARIADARRPRLLLALSALARLAGAVAVFYGLLQAGWEVLAAALVGFLAARQAWLAAKGGRRGWKAGPFSGRPDPPRHSPRPGGRRLEG